jgi:SAM-dependent methyltransferase/predicted DsbA family dithiol-disulfide isomerase
MTEAPIEIIHFADPWCWWSWGLEPILQRLREVYGDRVRVTYRMGGEFEDLDEWRKEYGVDAKSEQDWIRESVELMGMPVVPDYYTRTGVRSSYPACLAFKAAQRQSEGSATRYIRRMMEAFMVECRPATLETLMALATEIGLDAGRMRIDMNSAEVMAAFEEDRDEMAVSGVNYLSLMIRNPEGQSEVKGEVFTAKPFEEIIDNLVPGLPKRSPADILEYIDHHRGLTPAQEIAEVFRIPHDEARDRLTKLASSGILRAHASPAGMFWRWAGTQLDRLPIEMVKVSHVPPEVQVDATTDLKPIITKAVQSLYSEVASRPEKEYHFPLGIDALRHIGYPDQVLAKLPPTATESFAGVGFPHAANAIRPGDTVLDIGSGSGTDVLYAALLVGPTGKVYGLDITPAMIAKARANIERMGMTNVTILEGDATKIPVPDLSIDVVTSNGVLNLVPDKPMAFREIFRILKPSGHLQLADIVVQSDVGAVCGLNPQLWADCIGGAAVEADYLETIRTVGFEDVRIVRRLDYFAKSSSDSTKRITKTFGAESIVVAARRPA